MSKCGRCKGRGYVKPTIGFGDQTCPVCQGRGVRTKHEPQKRARRESVPLVPGARCIVCNEYAVQNHHLVKQQRIDAIVKPESLATMAKQDPRGVIPTCLACHDKVEAGDIHLRPHELPRNFAQYVTDFRLYPALPQYLKESEAA